MELDEVTIKRKENDELMAVASLIRPLPDNVIPSDEFVRRTRLRLLQLEGKSRSTDRQAA